MIHTGDCVEVMKVMPDASVDAVVTDPPYLLEFMGKAWDGPAQMSGHNDPTLPEGHGGKAHDHGVAGHWQPHWMQAWHEQWATEAFRVLKPGGYLLAFGGTRTVHRLASAIEDAGFEIRDELVWIYASGFPKSLDVSKALDKRGGAKREVIGKKRAIPGVAFTSEGPAELDVTAPATDLARQWQGWGTALKPAHEPIVMARKPLQGTVAANVTRWGTGALNIDGTRIGTEQAWRYPNGPKGNTDYSTIYGGGEGLPRMEEPREGPNGRWPSNVLLSDPELFDRQNPYVVGSGATTTSRASDYDWEDSGNDNPTRVAHNIKSGVHFEDSGGYSRFFIVPKADRAEREPVLRGQLPLGDRVLNSGSSGRTQIDGEWVETHSTPQQRENSHPTVKPVDLMRHLVRLVTPSGGTVLDPFLGSGSTAIACELEGFPWIGIEKEPEYVAIAEARLNGTQRGLGLE